MKQSFIILILLLISISLIAQEFDYRPSTNRLSMTGPSGAGFDMRIITNNAYNYGKFDVLDAEDEAIVSLGYNNGGQITLKEFASQVKSVYSKNEINFENTGTKRTALGLDDGLQVFNSSGNEIYTVNINDGFRAYSSTGQSLYRVSSAGFQAFDNNGQVSVRIQGDVSGDGRVSTNELEITGGSDLSEQFDISKEDSKIEPGMIVSISDLEGQLAVTKSKRDKKVVGIVSGANGIETGMLMGQRGSIADGDYPVALTGRTYVLANSENGKIEPGDFITSSSIPGYGMKVKNHKKARGAIIGKAMTSLVEETGYVLVLVNLQ